MSNIRDFLHTLKVKKQKEVQHSCMLQLRLRKYGLNASCMNSRNDLSLRAFYRMKNRAKEISMVTMIIDLYEISLKLNPKNSMAAQRFALFYENVEMNKEAIEILHTSLENKWDYDVAKQLVNLFVECEEEDMLRDAWN